LLREDIKEWAGAIARQYIDVDHCPQPLKERYIQQFEEQERKSKAKVVVGNKLEIPPLAPSGMPQQPFYAQSAKSV
jgi:hypothetical protein